MKRRRWIGSVEGCLGKKVYTSYWAANRATKQLAKFQEGSKINLYRCSNCHYWHIGNTLKGNTGRKRLNRKEGKTRYRYG